jgi:hypothetical protein
VPRLIGSPSRRDSEMDVAVGRHQKSDLRAPLGDPSGGSRKEARRPGPLASRMKKQNVQ